MELFITYLQYFYEFIINLIFLYKINLGKIIIYFEII